MTCNISFEEDIRTCECKQIECKRLELTSIAVETFYNSKYHEFHPLTKTGEFLDYCFTIGSEVIQQYRHCEYLATEFLISENFIQIQIPRTKHLEARNVMPVYSPAVDTVCDQSGSSKYL